MARSPGYNEQAFPAKGEGILAAIQVPGDLDAVLDTAWEAARNVPGFLMEAEARLLGTIAACAPAGGTIVEIGSFKGKSTVMLAKVTAHYGLGRVVAIDPHNFNSDELAGFKTGPEATSYREFLGNLETAGVAGQVEVHRAYSTDVAREWSRPIGFLWIDGDHSYKGAKADFDGFFSHVPTARNRCPARRLARVLRPNSSLCGGNAALGSIWRGWLRRLDCAGRSSGPRMEAASRNNAPSFSVPPRA